MKRSELLFDYPEDLVGTSPIYPPRVMRTQLSKQQDSIQVMESDDVQEISWQSFLDSFMVSDVLVLNDTKVLKCRVFAVDGTEILFLTRTRFKEQNGSLEQEQEGEQENQNQNQLELEQEFWEVLFPSKKYKLGDKIDLPLGYQAELVQKGRPQILKTLRPLTDSYFEDVGELPLPPYIQRARQERHNKNTDEQDYQTVWAQKPGSLAAPTASLHFKTQDLEYLKMKGVQILKITLHVGLGTFLPITVEDLKDHSMHSEWVEISDEVWQKIQEAKKQQKRVWALGTTVCRSLESQELGYFHRDSKYDSQGVEKAVWVGQTDLLIRPGFEFKVVDNLITNFHQPESTLLALVAAFSNLELVKSVYKKAIDLRMRLFSYGDVSVWIKK